MVPVVHCNWFQAVVWVYCVMIAIALACEPKLLIADEPTTALDVTIQAQILDLLRELVTERGTALVLITHDLGVVAGTCERVQVMYAGTLVETGTADDVFAAPRHPYTLGLLQSVPRLDVGRRQPLRPIPGSPRDMLSVIGDAAFRMPGPRALPLWAALLGVATIVALSILVLERRIRGVEVIK